MDGETKFLIGVISIVLIITVGICHYNNKENILSKEMAELGYVQKQALDEYTFIWSKE